MICCVYYRVQLKESVLLRQKVSTAAAHTDEIEQIFENVICICYNMLVCIFLI